MKILWDERAWEEYLEWQTQDKKTLKRINMLIKDIQRDCYAGIGKPEPLKRIVYKEKDGAVIIASCKGHYED